MAINLSRNRLYDKYKAAGLSDEDALMRADKEAQVTQAQVQPIQQQEAQPSWIESLKNKIVQYFGNQKNQSDEQLQKQGYSLPEIMRFRSKGKLIKSNLGQ